jgi:hypothetical protein
VKLAKQVVALHARDLVCGEPYRIKWEARFKGESGAVMTVGHESRQSIMKHGKSGISGFRVGARTDRMQKILHFDNLDQNHLHSVASNAKYFVFRLRSFVF